MFTERKTFSSSFAGLGHAGARDRDHLLERRAVERRRDLGGRGVHAADHLGDGLGGRSPSRPGSSRSGEKASRKSSPAAQAASARGSAAPRRRWCPGRSSTRARRAGRGRSRLAICSAVEWMYELSGSRCRPSGVGHADHDRVALGQPVEVGGGAEPPARDRRGDPLRPDVLDVRLAPRESASTLAGSTSKPITRNPASRNTSASGSPT